MPLDSLHKNFTKRRNIIRIRRLVNVPKYRVYWKGHKLYSRLLFDSKKEAADYVITKGDFGMMSGDLKALYPELNPVPPVPELENTFPLVLYFATDADRQEFVVLVQEAKPGMITRSVVPYPRLPDHPATKETRNALSGDPGNFFEPN